MAEYGKSTNISRTNIGSKATDSASSKAVNTSIGSNRSMDRSQPRSVAPQSRPTRTAIHPGSRAGLNDHKSVHLQSNSSGYASKSNQHARYKSKEPLAKPEFKPNTGKAGCTPKMFDGRLTKSSLSSISRLSKILG